MSRSLSLFLSALALLLVAAGCGTVLNQVGKVTSRVMTTKTDDLSTAAVQVRFVRNLYPPETNTTEAEYVGDEWVAGQNMAVINFTKREGLGFYTIDGSVTLDGEPLAHARNGFYGQILDADDTAPKTFVVETTSGQTTSYTVGPTEPIAITAVNGEPEGATIDVTQDFTLTLDNPPGSEDSDVKISFLIDAMNNRAWQEVAHVRSRDEIVIPGDVFRHYQGVALTEGETYMLVERYRVASQGDPHVGASQIIETSWDAVPVTLTGLSNRKVHGMGVSLNKDLSRGLFVEGSVAGERGAVTYTASKPNAFLGRPFDTAQRLGMVSFGVRATRLTQSRSDVSTSTATYGTYKVTTTTYSYEKRQFPTFPDAAWERLTNEVYADLEQTLLDRWTVDLVPVETAMQAPSYAELQPIDDKVTEVEVEKGYKGSKPILPTTFGAIIGSISTTFASDRIDARLARELDVDGLFTATLDLEMQTDFDDPDAEGATRLVPRLSFRISGPPNGYQHGPTIYATGVVVGSGVPYDEAVSASGTTETFLRTMIQKEALLDGVRAALDDLMEAETTDSAYDRIWALK